MQLNDALLAYKYEQGIGFTTQYHKQNTTKPERISEDVKVNGFHLTDLLDSLPESSKGRKEQLLTVVWI